MSVAQSAIHAWRARVLSDENSLALELLDFQGSDDLERYVGRQVAMGVEDIPGPDAHVQGVMAGYDLFKTWKACTRQPMGALVTGGPYLIVDATWLARQPDSHPPRVWAALGRTGVSDLEWSSGKVLPVTLPIPDLARQIVEDGNQLIFVEGVEPILKGGWVVL